MKKNSMLRGEATFPLWFELSHDYVGPAVTEPINETVGLIRAGFSVVGLFLGRKLKISQEQNVKEFQFYISMQNFRLLGSIIKKKYSKVADPLKTSADQYKFERNQWKISIYHEFDGNQYLTNAHQFRLQKIHCKQIFHEFISTHLW